VNEGTQLPKQSTLSLQHGLHARAHREDHGSQSKTVHDRTGTTGWDCWRAGGNYQYCDQVCVYLCVCVYVCDVCDAKVFACERVYVCLGGRVHWCIGPPPPPMSRFSSLRSSWCSPLWRVPRRHTLLQHLQLLFFLPFLAGWKGKGSFIHATRRPMHAAVVALSFSTSAAAAQHHL
jgi:hypothetical protein